MIDGALPDPRRHAYRRDLAAESLRGLIEAERYVRGEPRQVSAPALPLRREPRFDATLDTEALLGETVTLYDESEGWAWVQLSRDGYVGYVPSEGLVPDFVPPTHRVSALRTYVYPQPDGKVPPLALLSLNALVPVAGEEGKFLALAGGGYIFARHTVPFGEAAPEHDRAGGHRLIQQRLPAQPGQGVLVSDEVGRPAALVAGLDSEHVLVEARQRAPVDVDVLGRETHESSHDLMQVTARDHIRLDRPGEIGRLRRVPIEVRAGRARFQSR